MEPIVIDAAKAVVVLLIVGGAGHVSGYLSGRAERMRSARERVASRRARRMEDLRHRAPEPDEEQGPDTALDEPVEGEIVSADIPARRRMTGLAAGSSDPGARRHLAADWHDQFDHIVELYGPAPDPSEEATPFFDAVSAALVQPTAEWLAVRSDTNPWDRPGPGGDTSPKPKVTPRLRKRKQKQKHAHGGTR